MWTEDQYDQFEKQMHEKFPKIFANQYGGFAIGPGWWHIIETLCGRIQSYIDWQESLKTKFPEKYVPCEQVVVTQIKEKFGELRFYFDGGDAYISGLVEMAEGWANSTCEQCGTPGKRRDGGWIRTLCDHHEAEHQKRISERNT